MKTARVCTIGIAGFLCLAMCFALAAAFAPAQTARAYDTYINSTPHFDESTFLDLDYGLYWYDNDSVIPKKAGTEGANFDPDKPTVIFTHGMKIDEGYNRRDLVSLWGSSEEGYNKKGYGNYMYDPQFYQVLLNMGYNVGHFYWNQLAEISIDEDYRIWSSDIEGGLSYFVTDETGSNRIKGDAEKNPKASVATLFGEAIKAGLGENYSKPWRLVGHSMGGQLVLATTQNLIHQKEAGKINAGLVPERVSLIDPYLTSTACAEGMRVDHLDYAPIAPGTWTAELAANALEDIADHNIAVDAYGGNQMVYRNYRTMSEISITNMDEGDPKIEELRTRYNKLSEKFCKNASWLFLQALASTYKGNFGMQCHCMIIDYYFTTIYEDEQKDNFGTVIPSFNSSTDYIRSMRGYCMLQKEKKGENPAYMHCTDFVRVDAFFTPVENWIQGVAKGYDSVDLIDATTMEVVQSAEINANGTYCFLNVDNGLYSVTYHAGDQKTTTSLTVDTEKNGKIVKLDEVTLPEERNGVKTLLLILIVPALIIIATVVLAIVSARSKNKGTTAAS